MIMKACYRKCLGFAGLLLLVCAQPVMAAEHFGIAIHPEATSDAATAEYCRQFTGQASAQWSAIAKKPLKVEAYCYRTGMEFGKLADYYLANKGVQVIGKPKNTPNDKNALFCLPGYKCASMQAGGIDLVLSAPWAVGPNSYRDTLIIIAKSK